MDEEKKIETAAQEPEQSDSGGVKLEEFTALVQQKLHEEYNRGLRVGIQSVSKIVMDMLNDKKVPFMTRVEKVRRFCKVAPGIEDRYNKILAEETEKAKAEYNQDAQNQETVE